LISALYMLVSVRKSLSPLAYLLSISLNRSSALRTAKALSSLLDHAVRTYNESRAKIKRKPSDMNQISNKGK